MEAVRNKLKTKEDEVVTLTRHLHSNNNWWKNSTRKTDVEMQGKIGGAITLTEERRYYRLHWSMETKLLVEKEKIGQS